MHTAGSEDAGLRWNRRIFARSTDGAFHEMSISLIGARKCLESTEDGFTMKIMLAISKMSQYRGLALILRCLRWGQGYDVTVIASSRDICRLSSLWECRLISVKDEALNAWLVILLYNNYFRGAWLYYLYFGFRKRIHMYRRRAQAADVNVA